MQLRTTLKVLALAAVLALPATSALAQTPGTAVQETTVNPDVLTLFSLGAKVYPSIFINGSGWFSYTGYTYKYFPGSGIYVGVKDGNLFLIGGPYGNDFTPRGSIAALNTMLTNAYDQATKVTAVTADFANVTSVKTTYDLPRLFEELTLTSTAVSGAVTIISQMKMVRKGVEQVGAISTERLLVTLTANNSTAVNVAEMWVDKDGTVRRFILNGFEYTAPATADALGRSLVSGMLIALAGADTPTVQTAISNQLKNPTALVQSVRNRTFGSTQYQTLVLSISAGGIFTYNAEVTDFGSFSMTTNYKVVTTGIGSNAFEVTAMKLR